MRLPDRLDYYESDIPSPEGDYTEWYPHVTCTVRGCDWNYAATWLDTADDGSVDWDAEHPAHGESE